MNTQLDSLVREALAPLRPDPAAFREATLAKLRAHPMERDRRPARIAALQALPMFMKGPATGWLSLPVVTLAALGATAIWAVLRLVRGSQGASAQEVDAPSADEMVSRWWAEHAAVSVLTLSLLVGTALLAPATALLGVILASTLHVAFLSVRLAASGRADGATLGRILSEFLGLLGGLLLVAGDWSSRWHANDLGIRVWVPMVLIGGSFLCEWLGGWRRRSVGQRIAGAVPVVVLAFLVTQVLTPRMKRPSQAQVARWAETFDEPVTNTVEWLRFSRVVEWVQEGRGVKLGLAPAQMMLDDAVRSERPIPRATRNAAAVAGLLPRTPGDDQDMQLRPAAVRDTVARYRAALDERHGNPVARVGALHRGLRLTGRDGTVEEHELLHLEQELARLSRPGWIEALSPIWLRQLTIQPYRYEAAAALERLEASPAWRSLPRQTPSPWTSGTLALAAACIVVLLSVAVTWQGEAQIASSTD